LAASWWDLDKAKQSFEKWLWVLDEAW
jgi:hypothetical protein